MHRTLIAAALLAACPLPASAATLRPMTTLHAPVVLLSDLFDDAGPLAARVLGPAPEPGERIVVPATQLAAIARMFGVDWRPTTPADSAVLERPGKLLSRVLVADAVRTALLGAGASPDMDLEMPGLDAPLVPAEAHPSAEVEQLDYNDASGRFTAGVLVSGAQMPPLHLRVSGSVEVMAVVMVATQRLPAGTVLRAEDLQPARVRAVLLREEVARDATQAVGMALRHAVFPGQPLPLADLVHPGLVTRGASVVMEIDTGGLVATAQGVALGSAGPGEHIQVLNPISHMVVEGEVAPNGLVLVAPGSVPLPAFGRLASR